MDIKNYRHLSIFYILLDSNNPITSTELSHLVKVSVRTIKNDMAFVKAIAAKYHIEVISKPGKGYFLTYRDIDDYQQIKLKLLQRYRDRNLIPTEFLQRVNYIIRRLISTKDFLKLEVLSSELFISKHAIATAMKKVREILAIYKINLINKPGYGMKLQCNEYHLRLCMVDYFEFFHHEVEPTFSTPDFLEMFDFDFNERLQIRHSVLETLRHLNISIPDWCSQKLIIHLLCMRSRVRRNHFINLPIDKLTFLKELPEYSLSRNILYNLGKFTDFSLLQVESEIAYFSIFLLTGRDILDDTFDKTPYKQFYQQSVHLLAKIKQTLLTVYQIDTSIYSYFQPDMINLLMPLCAQIKFNIIDIQGSPAKSNHIGQDIVYSPISLELSLTMAKIIEEEMQTKIYQTDLLNLAYISYCMIENIPFQFKKLNLLLLPENNRISVRSIIYKIQKQYSAYINKIDVFNLYALRKINLSEYTAVLSAHRLPENLFINSFGLPLVKIDYFITSNDMKKLFHQVILKNYRFFSLLPPLEKNKIYLNHQLNTIDEFCKMIAYKHSKNASDFAFLHQQFKQKIERIEFSIKNQTLVLTNISPSIKKDIFEIFTFEKPLLWKRNIIQYAVFISVEIKNLETLKALELVTRKLTREPIIKRLLDNEIKDIYEEILSSNDFYQ